MNNKFLKLKTLQNKINNIDNQIKESLLNIIIIKKSNVNISNFFSNHQNINISIITDKKENIPSHYNEHITDNYEKTLNIILNNNKSKYIMIIFDNYIFQSNFVNLIYNEIINLNSDLLLLFNDKQNNNFNINIKFLHKINEQFICIFNNNIKKDYKYSISEIGLILYYNELINNYENFQCSTNIKFDIIEERNQINEMFKLFNIFMNQIEEIIFNQNIIYNSIDLLE